MFVVQYRRQVQSSVMVDSARRSKRRTLDINTNSFTIFGQRWRFNKYLKNSRQSTFLFECRRFVWAGHVLAFVAA